MKLKIAPELAIAILTITGLAKSTKSVSRGASPATIFHSDLNAPLLTDCVQLRNSLTGSENFSINVDSETELARFETCAIIVHNPSVEFVNVGAEDLFKLLNSTIPAVGSHGHLKYDGVLFFKGSDGVTEVNVDYRIDLPEV
ncbi:hypothetical protein B0T14DRAFT_565013 [Immersiella caudata]|uniref:Ecp2 effector protein-like domain-containing protein n=1 Tax=Immersiella caudata TaxID=314043 RepID=A0AA39WY11_9PEZI|nr:hypothetical protein B0T14DRAFT_565013 [Immersiella caudata]